MSPTHFFLPDFVFLFVKFLFFFFPNLVHTLFLEKLWSQTLSFMIPPLVCIPFQWCRGRVLAWTQACCYFTVNQTLSCWWAGSPQPPQHTESSQREWLGCRKLWYLPNDVGNLASLLLLLSPAWGHSPSSRAPVRAPKNLKPLPADEDDSWCLWGRL